MGDLAAKSCVPCEGGVPPLADDLQQQLLAQLKEEGEGWQLIEGHHLEKTFTFPDFKQALAFTNKVGEIAEAEGHHPDLYLAWGKLKVTIWTHKIDGLTESDFVLAAKVERARG